MKFSKKIVVASLSTVMGLSLVGAISGAVAWYQYSTRARVSFVGTSVANTGVLQIGQMGESEIEWQRDLSGTALTGSTNNNKLSPVTFGQLNSDGTLPEQAYANPQSGYGRYTDYNNKGRGWDKATKGVEYVQFDVYLRAFKTDGDTSTVTPIAKEVYLTDIVLADATENMLASDALRVHIDVDGGKKMLISKNNVGELKLYGNLDLDNNTAATAEDKLDGANNWSWETAAELGETLGENGKLIYGTNGDKQVTQPISDIKCSRDANGEIYFEDELHEKHYKSSTDPVLGNKVICTTSADAANPVKLTITVWLEGWHTYEDKSIWDATKTANTNVNVGLQFDVGRNAFAS